MFQDLLKQTNNLHQQCCLYAKKLKMSPQNLNAICRKNSNNPHLKYWQNILLVKQKDNCYTTENSISEIAFNLNFNDSSYFTKYFKRYVGITPKSFREM
ncbi:helix-turn-helix domain-containing protein [Myroides fluvii]|uniref:helix-turn-helix domain-containing protein n=1 Tax=Myroides fluvii TaxID=2572594 RepID=UPI0021CE870C|nr:helix-turn-helix domain-containing protein [Myroides fluvii]